MTQKRILITGIDSYIGTNFISWLYKWPDKYLVEKISLRTEAWKQKQFSNYEVILHVAGIAHVSADPAMEQLYYKINCDLAIDVAYKAKNDGVKQFIFMSSMTIYGEDPSIGNSKLITRATKPTPTDFYGKSKLQADLIIQKLNSEDFKTIVVRTPMVYGPKCKGNFPRLLQLAKRSPIFPDIDNQRSMIYIDNLCEFLRRVIDNHAYGIFYPQNQQYVCTKEIIRIVAISVGKRIFFTKLFNPVIKMLSGKSKTINKLLGSKVYDLSLSGDFDYCVIDFENSIKISMQTGG